MRVVVLVRAVFTRAALPARIGRCANKVSAFRARVVLRAGRGAVRGSILVLADLALDACKLSFELFSVGCRFNPFPFAALCLRFAFCLVLFSVLILAALAFDAARSRFLE